MGWKRRRVQIRTKKPEVHEMKVITAEQTSTIPLSSLMCDMCNAKLDDGTNAYALTEWQEGREGEPGPWENEFSQPN